MKEKMSIEELIEKLKNPDGYGCKSYGEEGHMKADDALLDFIASNFGEQGEEAKRIFKSASKWYA